MKHLHKPRLDVKTFKEGILSGDRSVLGQAITLIESNLNSDKVLATGLLEKILPHTGNALRIGITGAPGVGKSTFIESFGKIIIGHGKKLAVLTIDPSSLATKGSILGDKTRMEELSKNSMAYIRPSASYNALGGVAFKTREAMLLCEAAGYEVVIIETVGVGQSEVSVKGMVDFFLLLMLAGAGDDLQGIKKGITEMADALIITKADGENIKHATAAQATYQHAFHLLSKTESEWQPVVLTSSATTGAGMVDVWKMILKYQHETKSSGFFQRNRALQNIIWFREFFMQLLNADIHKFQSLQKFQKELEGSVANQTVSAETAARELLSAYHQSIKGIKS